MKSNKKNRLFKTFLSSYLILLTVTLLLNVSVYFQSYQRIEQNTLENHILLLQQTADSIERLVEDIQNTGKRALASRYVESLMFSTPSELSVRKKMSVMYLQKELLSATAYNSYFNEIYMYFSNPQLAASTSGIQYQQEFEHTLKEKLNFSFEEFSSLFLRQNGMISIAITTDAYNQPVIAACVYDAVVTQTPVVTCMMLLNTHPIQKILDMKESSELETAWLIDESAHILSSSSSSQLPADLVEKINQDTRCDSHFSYQIDGKPYQILQIGLSVPGWKLVCAIDMEQYCKPLADTQKAYLYITAVCLALGIAIAFFFSRRNTSRIQKITHQFIKGLEPDDQSRDELALLEGGIRRLLEKNESYQDSIRQHLPQLQQAWLIRVMHGKIKSPDIFSQNNADYQLRFSSNLFFVIGLEITNYSADTVQTEDSNEDVFEMINYSLGLFARQFLNRHYDCEVCTYNDNLFCIVSFRKAPDLTDVNAARGCMKQILDYSGEMVSYIESKIDVTLRCYVSHPEEGPEGIAKAYAETRDGMEQMDVFSLPMKIASQEDLLNSMYTQEDSENPELLLSMLSNLVADGNCGQVWPVFSASLSAMGPSRKKSSFQCLKSYALLIVNQMAENLFKSDAHALLIRYEVAEQISGLNNLKELQDFVQLFSSQLHQLLNEKDAVPSGLANEVKEYIDEHYSDSMMTVYSLADIFHISQSYLLRVFKKDMKMGVLEYISHCRVNEAKRLLKESSATINEIAEKVGYTNSLALIRAFKKYENLTPTAYRKIF